MLLLVVFGPSGDIIDVPQSVIENVMKYRNEFFEWLYDKSIDHKYWWYENGEKCGCHFRSEAFVEWLNANPLRETQEKAKVTSNCLPLIYF